MEDPTDLIQNITSAFDKILKHIDDVDIQISETYEHGRWVSILINAAQEPYNLPQLARDVKASKLPKLVGGG